MKKELDKHIENNEEVKKIKSQYKKILNLVFTLLAIIIIIFTINFIRTYSKFYKILKNNIGVDLGDNYKITTYIDGDVIYTYCKNGIIKTVRNIDKVNEIISIQTNEKSYIILEKSKEFWDMPNINREVNKANLMSIMLLEEDITIKNIVTWMITENISIEKEVYEGKKYIVLNMEMTKLWVNPETYYIEREMNFGQEFKNKIEKNVVTDKDVEIPKLEEYKYNGMLEIEME